MAIRQQARDRKGPVTNRATRQYRLGIGARVVLLVIAMGAAGGAAVGWVAVRAGLPMPHMLQQSEEAAQIEQSAVPPPLAQDWTAQRAPADAESPPGSIAMHYALAVQNRDCEEVIRLAQWMNDRLAQIKLKSGDPEALKAAKEALCKRVSNWNIEENQLTAEGLDDPYVFAPGAQIEEAGQDRVSDDESFPQPVRERTWLRVTYTGKQRAPRDEAGQPIRSMRVGVVVSTDGKILKAGIKGNMEIDEKSVSTRWKPGEGG